MIPDKYSTILKELVLAALDAPDGIDAVKFRAAHEDDIKMLNELEHSQYLEREDQQYFVSLLAFSELKECDQRIGSVLYLCEYLFTSLRSFYKESAGERITLKELVGQVDLPDRRVRRGLKYLARLPIWGGYTTDLMNSQEVSVTPGESILEFKTFNDVIARLREWEEKQPYGSALRSMKNAEGIEDYDNSSVVDNPGGYSFPDWHEKLPEKIKLLMEEVYRGLEINMSALPSMGLRSIIDEVCNDKIGDAGTFKAKLDALEKKHITQKNREILETILELGHASIHRGYFPSSDDLLDALDVVEHLLKEAYVLHEKSVRIKAKVPARGKRI